MVSCICHVITSESSPKHWTELNLIAGGKFGFHITVSGIEHFQCVNVQEYI
jgi:hypothetical protein